MIWEKDISLVIMLTKIIESGKIKSHRYYTEHADQEHEKVYGFFQIDPIEISDDPETEITKRVYKVTHKETGEHRTVTHLQYTGWPDHDIPTNLKGIEEILRVIDTNVKEFGKPILIHCSAGVGRSGALCAVHIQYTKLRRYLEDKNAQKKPFDFDVLPTVIGMRNERKGMVQEPEQLRFIYEILLDFSEQLGYHFPSEVKGEPFARLSNKSRKSEAEDKPLVENEETKEEEKSEPKGETRDRKDSEKKEHKKPVDEEEKELLSTTPVESDKEKS